MGTVAAVARDGGDLVRSGAARTGERERGERARGGEKDWGDAQGLHGADRGRGGKQEVASGVGMVATQRPACLSQGRRRPCPWAGPLWLVGPLCQVGLFLYSSFSFYFCYLF